MKSFPFYKQLNAMDCGPTCIRMIAKYYGKHYKADTLRQIAGFSKRGVSMLGISETAEKIGFRTRGVKITLQKLQEVQLPAVIHWNQNHFVVLTSVNNKYAKIADPSHGISNIVLNEFIKKWGSSIDKDGNNTGVILLLEPTSNFYESFDEKEQKLSWSIAFQYLKNSKWQITQVFLALVITSIFSLVFPFLTQSIIDNGINVHNLQYITIVLLAQIMLTFSQTIVDFIKSRLLLRIANNLNLQILSDFWIKLTKLPIAYFDNRQIGDTLQRIRDNKTIQSFLTNTSLSTLFSFFNFFIYAAILIIYNVQLFIIFLLGSILYIFWVQLFLKFRRKFNYQNFHLSSKENNATLQLVQGMQEIRLNNAEKQKRWEWENIQVNLFKLSFKNLNYSQIQTAGATFINQIQGITISFVVAKLVIDGTLTLGAMLAIQYIIGQLTGPISLWVSFVQSLQDAKISMERLNEIHQLEDEESSEKLYLNQLPECKSISLENLSFTYPGAGNEPVLNEINLIIPEKKVTAIVGASGSGKTTLLKILLKVYEQFQGEIRVGTNEFPNSKNGLQFTYISHKYWRSLCGSVLQDGYIFNDTIARNISVGDETINFDNLISSCKIANIHSFIESLPNGYYTMLGSEGTGLSQGQKQRILIARAVYKNPEYLFFDEATNSLDANNEKEILQSLNKVFFGKTVIVVAHRLSTVKNANNIVVLEKGKIVEQGTHEALTNLKGKYFELVKNQLELGKE